MIRQGVSASGIPGYLVSLDLIQCDRVPFCDASSESRLFDVIRNLQTFTWALPAVVWPFALSCSPILGRLARVRGSSHGQFLLWPAPTDIPGRGLL